MRHKDSTDIVTDKITGIKKSGEAHFPTFLISYNLYPIIHIAN